jgi:hypothetical protein
VKRPTQPSGLQLNLPLLDTPAAAVPEGKQKELTLALVELLISGFQDSVPSPTTGGGDEPEADD